MKIDLNYKIKDLDGKVIKDDIQDTDKNDNPQYDGDGKVKRKKGKAITLRMVCERALLNPDVTIDQRTGKMVQIPIDPTEKVHRYDLALQIHKADGLFDIGVDDIKLLKDLIGRKFPPLTVGQAYRILDPTTKN